MSAVALSIAGSDSGGGAGLQADLRTFCRLGVYGTTVVTAVTAQNPSAVTGVVTLEAPFVRQQIEAVLTGFDVSASKTGMLATTGIVHEVAALARAASRPLGALVVDPVMVATSGARLLDEHAIAAYRDVLCPAATIVTPNLAEARALLDHHDDDDDSDPETLARALEERLGAPILLKGGHAAGPPVDVLCVDAVTRRFPHERVTGTSTHGTGCTLAAALAAYLARGEPLADAAQAAIAFVQRALWAPHAPAGGPKQLGIENA